MDYLKLTLKTRLARWRKNAPPQSCYYPRPDGTPYRIPELRPEADRNGQRWGLHGAKTGTLLFWENSEQLARSIKFADEVCPHTRHRGWYVDQFQDETCRGLVLALSHGRFLAAVSDPWNFDEKARSGPCILETGEVFDSEREAALAADDLAEGYAEDCREDAEKQEAERVAEELAQAEKDAAELELSTEQAACWP